MPFYEYECEKCGKRTEVMQKMSDPPLETCECGGKLRKIFHSPAVHFKGSGFYATDYGRSTTPKPTGEPGEGYDMVDREREKRAEQGDKISQRVLDAKSKSAERHKENSAHDQAVRRKAKEKKK